jgi:RHS repeat-associated protein
VREWEGEATKDFIRGPDRGGGVGGLICSLDASGVRMNHYNSRGDVVAQTDQGGNIPWSTNYTGRGTRFASWGTNNDKQRANTKEEAPNGLLNEGFRYRDLETGVFIQRDPAGFVDGPNLYAYVRQNPWTKFDPEGLREKTAQDVTPGSGHHKVPVELWDQYKFGRQAQEVFNSSDARIATDGHNATRHPKYSREVESELQSFIQSKKIPNNDIGGLMFWFSVNDPNRRWVKLLGRVFVGV